MVDVARALEPDPIADDVDAIFAEHEAVVRAARAMAHDVRRAAVLVVSALRSGGKLLVCGNGGSAADAQHLAAELVGRFAAERRALPAIALTTDSSVLTALANDFGYETVFARQVEALGRPGDVLLAISTSGTSRNVLAAARTAAAGGLRVIGLTGHAGGLLAEASDVCLAVPSRDTARVQELHILLGHILCRIVEAQAC